MTYLKFIQFFLLKLEFFFTTFKFLCLFLVFDDLKSTKLVKNDIIKQCVVVVFQNVIRGITMV